MNEDKLFRQALQRQNDRAQSMKMPDDMELRVMGSLTPNLSPRKRELLSPFFWRVTGGGCIAASVVLLIMLGIGQMHQTNQNNALTEETTQPKDEVREIVPCDDAKLNTLSRPTKHVKSANLTRLVSRVHVSSSKAPQQPTENRELVEQSDIPAEPALAEAGQAQEVLEQHNDYLPQQPDPFLLAAAQTQEIRSRGEQLYQKVAQIITNSKHIE